ncbi:hypothetical protein ASZ78_011200 [Callipepla squamata]|uniref:CEP152 CEP63 binding coiled coil domain-containing protein n=1 Tax=Callipepla squamata TaxID=9009 RepID=A0A226N6T1_CALSU|nr:hypothetical protein ASZ78_011200 [Callipepla squamata]
MRGNECGTLKCVLILLKLSLKQKPSLSFLSQLNDLLDWMLKQFVTSEVVSDQSVEPYKVMYKPYQNDDHKNIPLTQEGMRRNEVFEDLQHEFTGNDERSCWVFGCVSHTLIVLLSEDEKDGLAVSLRECQTLYQNGKEREVYLEGQIKALETQIQNLTTKEEQILKQSRVAEVAMESMQKQLLELQQSDTLQRAREHHEAIITALKQKHEEQVLSLEQKLNTTESALREQKELCQSLGEHVKELEKMLEETKCEKTEIINRLTRSLEESQKQCANLLQTGSIQEANQLRFQLQQAQSAHMISNNLNKALQEELMELKEEMTLYESAAKLGVFLNDTDGELPTDLSDSCADLGIKKATVNNSRFCSIMQKAGMDKELSEDDIIVKLKAELKRLLSSNKMKRNQITQLQNDLKDCQNKLEEFKQLLKAEKASKESEPVTNQSEALASPLVSDNLKEEVLRLRKVNETLRSELQSHALTIEQLKENEEKLKSSNQDLCCQMRKMIQEFDEDKQETIDRCERTYQQHHEDTKAQFERDIMQRCAEEKKLFKVIIRSYEESVSKLKASIEELNREMTTVKECYIAVCGEKDTLETTLRQKFAEEQQVKEDKLKKQLLEEKEESLKILRSELEERYNNSITEAKRQWQKEKEVQVEKEVAFAKLHWEKEEKELALAFSSDEEKWKNEHENTETSGSRIKELEEKVVSLKKELELKEKEIPVTIKAAVSKARAQWNKLKQEEIAQIQEQNEREYRLFLDDHRNKIEEVLATMKKNIAKRMNDLSAQKEAEMQMLLDQKQQEWEAQETKRLKDEINWYEEKTLVELECLLREVHEELIESTDNQHTWEESYSDAPVESNHQYKDKLKACLQKAYRRTVHKILEKHEQERKEKNEELVNNANKKADSCMQGGDGETGDVTKRTLYNSGQQGETPGKRENGTDGDEQGAERNLWSQEDMCCKHRSQELGKKETLCQYLKTELNAARKHCLIALLEWKATLEEVQEKDKLVESLITENTEMRAKLRDIGTSPRTLSKGGISKACTSCDAVKGLEQLRAQYIKAVTKIKSDMACYIRESRERAAAVIKAEVIRERQEMARKMRNYYLTCLQQLLTDNGKHEGAEKKIMNAASKLVTMSEGLETPLQQHRSTRSALLLNSDLPTGVEYSGRDGLSQNRPNNMESKSCGRNASEDVNDKVVQKHIPRDLRQQFDASQTETQRMLHDASNIQNRNICNGLVNAGRDGLLEILPKADGRKEKYSPIQLLEDSGNQLSKHSDSSICETEEQ